MTRQFGQAKRATITLRIVDQNFRRGNRGIMNERRLARNTLTDVEAGDSVSESAPFPGMNGKALSVRGRLGSRRAANRL